MIVPLRAGPGFGATVYRREPDPTPTPVPVTVIQATLLHAAQLQEPEDAVTATDPAPPVAGTAAVGGASVNVHPGCGAAAITMPMPESRSTPGASMSRAVAKSALLSCVCVKPGFADLMSAMIAAACGAAADVPKNCPGKSPAPVTNTPSAAVRSGFCNTAPPVDEKLPGVTAVPSPRKKTRRGPSELNVSIDVGRAERIRIREAGVRGGHAEREDVAGRGCARASGRRSRSPASRGWCSGAENVRRRAVAFTTTMRGLAVLLLICSYGSSLPFWMFVELAATIVPAAFSRKMS